MCVCVIESLTSEPVKCGAFSLEGSWRFSSTWTSLTSDVLSVSSMCVCVIESLTSEPVCTSETAAFIN
ncbi:uncharacterized protein Smp_202540 [Schistosoma mansoni]|uniref:uncharacterized protein n=1 Tax=Schistosoma mansoni TaxID=6183 RepID=UPI00022DC381|nr:uncharacterized protein Smp_202540 [Schistosoma mansoni]|eukprot:XP_018652094.1 uncharacterized protein Smp_202540 [Schistosoma mansoni]